MKKEKRYKKWEDEAKIKKIDVSDYIKLKENEWELYLLEQKQNHEKNLEIKKQNKNYNENIHNKLLILLNEKKLKEEEKIKEIEKEYNPIITEYNEYRKRKKEYDKEFLLNIHYKTIYEYKDKYIDSLNQIRQTQIDKKEKDLLKPKKHHYDLVFEINDNIKEKIQKLGDKNLLILYFLINTIPHLTKNEKNLSQYCIEIIKSKHFVEQIISKQFFEEQTKITKIL